MTHEHQSTFHLTLTGLINYARIPAAMNILAHQLNPHSRRTRYCSGFACQRRFIITEASRPLTIRFFRGNVFLKNSKTLLLSYFCPKKWYLRDMDGPNIPATFGLRSRVTHLPIAHAATKRLDTKKSHKSYIIGEVEKPHIKS